jgi:hypothetical protein
MCIMTKRNSSLCSPQRIYAVQMRVAHSVYHCHTMLTYCVPVHVCVIYDMFQAAVCGGTSDIGHGSEPYEIYELFGLHNQLIASTAPFDVTYLSDKLQPIGRIRDILATCTQSQKVNT